MRTFDSLTEREALALAISQEEEDARIYDNFAEGLRERYPEQAEKFTKLRQDEDSHRHRLLDLYRSRFGDHVPLMRRQDVRGFVSRRPVWLVMTTLGGLGHSLPYLIRNVKTATWLAVVVVMIELGLIAWVRRRYMDTPWSSAVIQVVLGGLLVFGVGILIGNS